MGQDIHAHIEVKIAGDWEHYSCPPILRNRTLFDRIRRLGQHRGIPIDCSVVTLACYHYEQCDAHSGSTLNKYELCALINYMEQTDHVFQHHQIGYLTGNSFDLDPDSTPPEITDVRFICWFDN